MRAKAAQENGFFAREIAPVEIAGRKGTVTVDRDEHPRGDTTLEGLAKLRAPFRKQGGTVTAGNASGRERRRRGADHRLGSRRRRATD